MPVNSFLKFSLCPFIGLIKIMKWLFVFEKIIEHTTLIDYILFQLQTFIRDTIFLTKTPFLETCDVTVFCKPLRKHCNINILIG